MNTALPSPAAHNGKPYIPSPQGQSAIRLINTKKLDRQAWLAVRKQGIGSSEAAAAVGLNPFQSQLALWLQKTGCDSEMPHIDENDDTHPVYWGNLLEPVVAQHYSKRTGRKVRRINAVLQHPNEPWMLANIDREIIGSDEVQILECKTAGINGAKLWKDGVPEYVQIQVMHQLAVTGKQAADVAVLIGGQELQIHRIERNEAAIAHLIELERRFWQYVEQDIAPPADGSLSAEQALRCLFPQDNGETADFTHDADLNGVFDDLLALRRTIQTAEKEEGRLKQRIQQEMGEAAKALFRSGSVSWKRSKDSTVLDTVKLSAEHPALLAQYQTVKSGSRRFLLNGKRQ